MRTCQGVSRRGFIGRLVASGFGLGVGQAVRVQAVESRIERAPAILPPLDGRDILLTDMTLTERPFDQLLEDLRGRPMRVIRGRTTAALDLRFEGDGCLQLFMELRQQWRRCNGLGIPV